MGTKIAGTGSALPSLIVTNEDLAKKIDTSDEWIVTRTGIKQRHFIQDNESSLTLALEASKSAIAAANLDINNIDTVIVATMTPSKNMPSTASLLQKELNLSTGIAFDINVACSGFIYALNIADLLIKAQHSENILLVGVDVMSSMLDWTDRSTCVLFGDGAGAVILSSCKENKLYGGIMKANGCSADALQANPLLTMSGREVFKYAVKELEKLVPDTLEKFNMNFQDIDFLVAHQANIRIIQATAKLLNLDMSKAVVTIDKHANTAAASIPLALDYSIKNSLIKRGDCLLLEAFGAGFSWGSFILKY